MTARKAASSQKASSGREVTVKAPFQVNYDGKTYGPGETVKDVPAELAESWRRLGYIE